MTRIIMLALMTAMGLSGCAKKAHQVPATYVPTSRYMTMDCDRIGEELNRVAAEVTRVSGDQDEAAQRDAWATGIGIVLFFPALLVLAVPDEAQDLSRLKGEYEALDRARIEKRCLVA